MDSDAVRALYCRWLPELWSADPGAMATLAR